MVVYCLISFIFGVYNRAHRLYFKAESIKVELGKNMMRGTGGCWVSGNLHNRPDFKHIFRIEKEEFKGGNTLRDQSCQMTVTFCNSSIKDMALDEIKSPHPTIARIILQMRGILDGD